MLLKKHLPTQQTRSLPCTSAKITSPAMIKSNSKLLPLQAFGSRACGLELWNSDIDIAVLGMLEPAAANGGAPIA